MRYNILYIYIYECNTAGVQGGGVWRGNRGIPTAETGKTGPGGGSDSRRRPKSDHISEFLPAGNVCRARPGAPRPGRLLNQLNGRKFDAGEPGRGAGSGQRQNRSFSPIFRCGFGPPVGTKVAGRPGAHQGTRARKKKREGFIDVQLC